MDIQLLAFVIGGYLSGSVLYAFLIPCLFTGIDIRAMSPDGNPGTANVFHVCGARIGILVAMMEFSKGFLPVAMALAVLDVDTLQYGFVPVILAPVLGHMCSVLNHFHGGIGIAPTFGTLIAIFLESRLLIVVVAAYALTRLTGWFRENRSRTDFVFFTFLIFVLLFESHPVYRLAYVLVSLAILFRNYLQRVLSPQPDDCPGSVVKEL